MADDDDQVDHSRFCGTNDSAPSSNLGDNVEERFRVDRRKLEQLIQGGT